MILIEACCGDVGKISCAVFWKIKVKNIESKQDIAKEPYKMENPRKVFQVAPLPTKYKNKVPLM